MNKHISVRMEFKIHATPVPHRTVGEPVEVHGVRFMVHLVTDGDLALTHYASGLRMTPCNLLTCGGSIESIVERMAERGGGIESLKQKLNKQPILNK